MSEDITAQQRRPFFGRLEAAIGGALLLLVWAVFGQTTGFEFVDFDDSFVTGLIPVIHEGSLPHAIGWAFTHSAVGNWIPLTVLSHMADCWGYGWWAGGHHLINVILHGAAAILLFLALRQLTGARWRSALAAAFFAVHPLRAESVAWVSERKDVLSGVFFMLTLLAYARYAAREWSLARYSVVALVFALGLMAKPMLVTVPLVLLLLDGWPLCRWGKGSNRRLILEKLPLLALSGLASAAAMVANRSAIIPVGKLSLLLRVENALVAYAGYIRQLFYPVGLAAFYPHPKDALSSLAVGGSFALVVIVSIAAVFLLRRARYFAMGWFWYLGMLVPVIGVVQTGSLARADRYTYLPQIGLIVLLVWGAADLWTRWRLSARLGARLALALLCACTLRARTQTAVWRDSETLWTHALACTERNALATDSLGKVFLRKGRKVQALDLFHRALEIRPDSPETHFDLASVLQSDGVFGEAVRHYRQSLASAPANPSAWLGLGSSLVQLGNVEEGLAAYRAGLKIEPDHSGLRTNLGMLLAQMGDPAGSIAEYRGTLAVHPGEHMTINNLAWMLATTAREDLRNGSEAVALARQVNALTGGNDPQFLDTLAAACAESGRFPEAIATAEKAITLATDSAPELVDDIRARLALYRVGKPYRAP